MNAVNNAAARPKATKLVGDVQPCFGPSITAHTNTLTPAIDKAMPSGSKRRMVVSRDVGTTRQMATMATTITGTLTRNTEPQKKCSSRYPPVTGPSATARPLVAAQIEMAIARWRASVNTLTSSAKRRREDQRRPDAHRCAPGDQLAGRRRHRCKDRGRAERRHADHQRALATESIADAAGCHQQPGEHQHVGVDDPLQLAGGRAQFTHEGRQGDVHDGAVDDDDEDRGAQHRRESATVTAGVVGGVVHRRSFQLLFLLKRCHNIVITT